MSKFTISLASIGAALTETQAIAADIIPLFTYAAQVMEKVNDTAMTGDNKKTAVLNIVGLVATNAGKDFSAIATALGSFIDLSKSLYNEAVVAGEAVVAAVEAAVAPQGTAQ